MSLIDPLSCGFAKVAVFKYNQYITYFLQTFKKVIPNIKSLEKRYRHKKQEILTTFSKIEWDSLSYEVKKRHSRN